MGIKRNLFIDSLKFSLIFLVILGHLLGFYKEGNSINTAIWNFIYLFHMPLFVFVSGYFSKRTSYEKFKAGCFRILETFLLLQLLSFIPLLIKGTLTLEKIITPWWLSWYLFALLIWKSIYFIVNPKPNFHKKLLAISVILALGAGFIPQIGHPFSLSRIFVFFPFFILGTMCNERTLNKIKSIPKVYGFLFLSIVLIGFFWIDMDFAVILWGSKSYYSISHLYMGFLLRILFFVGAVGCSIAFYTLIPESKLLSKLGKDTLLFYAFHGFLVLFITAIINRYKLDTNIFLLLAAAILIILVIFLFSKSYMSRIILNPLTFYRKKKSG